MLVLKDGEIVHESYCKDTNVEDQRISWVIAKATFRRCSAVLRPKGTYHRWKTQ